MIKQSLTYIFYFIPVVLLFVRIIFYRRYSQRMHNFCWKMATSKNAIKLYSLMVLLAMMAYNMLSCYVQPTISNYVTAFLILPFINDSISRFILTMICNSTKIRILLISAILYLLYAGMFGSAGILMMLYIASEFYPSKECLKYVWGALDDDKYYDPTQTYEIARLKSYFSVLEKYYKYEIPAPEETSNSENETMQPQDSIESELKQTSQPITKHEEIN